VTGFAGKDSVSNRCRSGSLRWWQFHTQLTRPHERALVLASLEERPSSWRRQLPRSHLSWIKDNPPAKWGLAVFALVLAGGLVYIVWRLSIDLSPVHQASIFPYVLLGVALLIALGFEFVNGFHDTANAVATVIYTHSLEPHVAVVWSGLWNFIGVITSSGAVAFSIVSLLPVELILRVSKGSGFAMIFALLER
jgi:hypothetical protein